MSKTVTPPQKTRLRAPLGLPSGSIRALLTILVMGFIIRQTALNQRIGLLWSETLMIMLAHYFTSRRFVELPRELKEQLEAEGKIPHDQDPLYLPKHSIRGLIVLSFIGLGWYLYQEGRLFSQESLQLLGTVGAYFLGMLFKAIKNWFRSENAVHPANWWDDLKAVVTLGLVVGTIAVELLQLGGEIPIQQDQLESTMLGVILFYFGSR